MRFEYINYRRVRHIFQVGRFTGVYEKVVGGGRRDPLQRVRAHDVPMGGWGWCNEARYGRPLDASPPALRSACLFASNFFIPLRVRV